MEKARTQLADGDGIGMVRSSEASRLADDLDHVWGRLAELGQGPDESASELSPAEGRARLDEARQSLLDPEGALRSPALASDLVAKLEAVHVELVDALERPGARFWRAAKRAAPPVDELRATEADLLDRLGFASYSTYLMGYSIARADPQPAEALQGTRAELAEAKQALGDAAQRAAAAGRAEDRRAVLLDDLSVAEEIERSAVDDADEAEREMAAAKATEAPLATRFAEMEAEQERWGEELVNIEATVAGQDEPAVDPAALEAELAMAEAMQQDAGAALEALQISVASVEAERDALSVENERLRGLIAAEATSDATPMKELEWYLLSRLASQRSVSMAGSAPLLLDDTLRGIDAEDVDLLLTRLERMADAVQVIVISDDPVVVSWASNAGVERAAVISLQPC